MEYKKIKYFTKVVTGGTPSTNIIEYWDNGDIPWLNSGELNKGTINSSENYITKLGLENSVAKLMPPDTVLIALTGATTGVTALLKIEACANQSVTGILPSDKHIPEYLFYYLSSLREKILRRSWGGAQKHINQEYVKNIQIPLPPLSEQKQIAETLDKIDDLRQKRKQSIQLLDDYIKSVFYDKFGDPMENPFNYKKGSIRDLVSEVKYGTSSPAEANGKYPYLRMNNITIDGFMDLSNMKYINVGDEEKEKYMVKKGDLLFNRTNSKELVGKTCIFNESAEMIIAGYLIRVRTNELANPWYLWGYLNSLHGKKVLFNMCKSIIGMANINAQELQNIKILIPPVSLQNQFADIVLQVIKIKSKMEESLKEIENLFNSLMQKYFSNN